MNASATSAPAASVAEAPSERVSRHHLLDRIYHTLMAACVLTLMGSAFLPIVEQLGSKSARRRYVVPGGHAALDALGDTRKLSGPDDLLR